MPAERDERGVREAVGLFDTPDALQAVIDELLSSGFDRADISLLAPERTVEEKLGHTFRRTELEDSPSTPRAVYVSPDAVGTAEGGLISALAYVGGMVAAGVIAVSGGPLTVIVVGAVMAGGAGGLLGAGLAKLVGDRQASEIQDHLDEGGLLLWVRTWRAPDERRAIDILAKHSGRDVHLHSLVKTDATQPSPSTGTAP
jgi:hypothetical protein